MPLGLGTFFFGQNNNNLFDIDSEKLCNLFDCSFVKKAEVEVDAFGVDGEAAGLLDQLNHALQVVSFPRIGDSFLKIKIKVT